MNKIHSNIELALSRMYPKKSAAEVLIMLEEAMEKDMIEHLFPRFQITALQKSDRKSLPYQHEIVIKLPYESWMPGMMEYHRCYRKIFSELLKKNIHKIRFYIQVESSDNNLPLGKSKSGEVFNLNLGALVYKFRYYIHELK